MICPHVSIVLCTYRPHHGYLRRVLASINAQTIAAERREFILVDSASPEPVATLTDMPWPHGTRTVRADRPGLALARIIGFEASKADLVAFMDDDTVLNANYLANGLAFMDAHPHVGSVSGRIRAEFEAPPPAWLDEFNVLLAIRDFGDVPLVSQLGRTDEYPTYAPVGVSIFRREHFAAFQADCRNDVAHLTLGRNADSLASGEDNDFVMHMIRRGAQVAYCPAMELTHIIPARRLQLDYLGALSRASSRTWEQVQLLNGMTSRPPIPRWTLPLRKARAWLRHRAWRGGPHWVRWQGACGHFEGRVRA